MLKSLRERLRDAMKDKDNFPYMDTERRVPVGLAREADDEIERLQNNVHTVHAHLNHLRQMLDDERARTAELRALLAQATEALEWISVGKHSTVNNFAKDAVRRARVALAAIREAKP